MYRRSTPDGQRSIKEKAGEPVAFCVSCGNQMSEGAAFCGKCGAGAATPVRAVGAAQTTTTFFKVIFAPARMLLKICKDVLTAKSRWIRFGVPAVVVLLAVAAAFAPPDKDSATKPLEAGSAPVAVSTPADAPDASPPAKLAPLSDSELQYVSAIKSQAGTLGASMNRFHDLAVRPEIFNDDWKLSLVKELAIWQIVYGEAQKLQPSARFSALQGCWVGALGDLNGAASDIASGLDHSDVEELNAANGAISRSTGRIAVCAQEMAALSANVGR
jgi:hypothetical protein